MVSVTRLGAVVAFAAFAGPLPVTASAVAGPAAPAVRPARAEPVPDPQTGDEAQRPSDVIFVEVTPGTVEPGFLVGIRASCRDNSVPATVVSDAFGRVQVQPQRGLLSATPMVRDRTRPGNYRVKLECPNDGTASTMLQVVKRVNPTPTPTRQPTHRSVPGPATGFGGTADSGGFGGLLLPGGLALTIAGVTVGLVARRRPSGSARR
ncbi:hypothetical protein K7640_23835 [Micromonospora sp. PLK6-60]|uniref:hypothetical protein n=1 Tax=Micromonospora sp. PLK6-60 TaxID=2873383 RepID=UPI001CA6C2E5|nr:hypothetical protein [Micromonospora sp. PLK6-60]MBY8874863.1 hypothetical protein [Micromonospora sp. PLK6-60]